MRTILARDLEMGHIINRVQGNPNIRGTVTEVHKFGTPVASRQPAAKRGTQVQPSANSGGQENTAHLSRTLAVRTPPPMNQARAIAREVEACYADGDITSVSIMIAARTISLPADTQVEVWVPAADVDRMLLGMI